ncbi:LOW QUALITY PROTEIN: mucin-4 [Physeter macrocephalus]|uniref:LOW QUALITY PROTEIN: mucin-4 n=1 Tax=Physeter macrocephalus TaxID=9755 RepID=A0A9W2WQH7_PHYMC|nr:LOW QUALITY PROTEIN: mucin-4 [Physeter catodon]
MRSSPASPDTTTENTRDTSPTITRSITPVASTFSVKPSIEDHSTLPSSTTSTEETSAPSQDHQTQSIETTRETQSSTIRDVTTSTPSSSPRGHTLTEGTPQETSSSGETTTSSPASVSHTPATTSEMLTTQTSTDRNFSPSTGSNTSPTTSEMITSPSSTDTTVENTRDTSPTITRSITPVASTFSVKPGLEDQSTLPSSTTSTEETSAPSQDHQTQSIETTRETQSSTIRDVTTSTPSSSPRGHTLTEGTPQETSSSGETTTSSPASVSHTFPTTSEMLTTPTSTDRNFSPATGRNTSPTTSEMITSPASPDTTVENTRDISPTVMRSITPETSTFSVKPGIEDQSTVPSSTTSTEETSAPSQDHQTQSIETTRETQSSTIRDVTTSTPSSSPRGHTLTEGTPQQTSSSGETTTSSPASVSHTPATTNTSPTTSEMIPSPASPDTTVENTRDTSPTITRSITPIASTVSVKPGVEDQSTLPSSTTSTEETSAPSQDHQTQSIETTRETQSSTIRDCEPHTCDNVRNVDHTNLNRQKFLPVYWKKHISYNIRDDHITSFTRHHCRKHKGHITNYNENQCEPHTCDNVRNVDHTNLNRQKFLPAYWKQHISYNIRDDPITRFTRHHCRKHKGHITYYNENQCEPHTCDNVRNVDHTNLNRQKFLPVYWKKHISYNIRDDHITRFNRHHCRKHKGHITNCNEKHHSMAQLAQFSLKECLREEGTIVTSQKTDSGRSTATSLPSATSQTLTTSTAGNSRGTHSTAAPVSIKPEKGVSLFPYGLRAGDQEFVKRTVDFTSPLFKPQIGFPLGSSLRESLYFTDNGQIIFPESEYQIFSYPNPLLRGFTAWDPVALVAPFWDDADFSDSRGTIFYQEYETLYDEYNLLVREVESWIKMLTNTWNYKAKWTLKVTWVHAPAYPARGTIGTNTYQAILSTDGSRSYALFLYQSGGMQWDVTQRPGNPVLMGFSSGDGYFKNSPLTFQPVWEKYRPDQFLDSNSGLRGLQIYKLHKEEKPNYRLQCLQWLKRQSQWPSWGWNQISCPCSWRQGLWDLRFQPINIAWSGLGSRQLCSFSSWRGGVCCSYGPWGELLQGWRVQSPWQFDQELEPQNWCCHFNDKPYFCALYQLRRPRISCAGYQPPRPAWMFGDPHITTLDGANYTFNGLGDFLLVRTWDRNSSFLLQGHTAQTGSAQATNFIAFAAEYRSSSLDPITVQWFLKPSDTIHVRLNNQTVTFEPNREGAKGQEMFNTSGVVMTRNGSMVSANFDGAVTISVIALSNILHASCSLPEEYQNHTEGLMGFWNGNPDDDFRMPNGSALPPGSSEEMLFHYGMAWEINGTSLFGKREDHLPSNFTPVFFSQLSGNKSLNENLTSKCNGDKQCIYDALATGNKSLGLYTGMLFRKYQQMNTTLNQYPPSIEGPDVMEAYMGQAKLVNYTSSTKDVTFTLRNNYTDFKLFENGTLLWTPKLLGPYTLEILARSAKDNLSSVLKPRTVVCACKAESQCLYNQTSWVGDSSLEVAGCKCDGNTLGRYCNHSKDPCDEQCFPNVKCISGKGCEACPPNLTGDGRHCAPLENPFLCQNKSCPENYCYNNGHCYISQALACQPACTCPPAFTDTRCFLAGNNFTPTVRLELPLRIIHLSLIEDEVASQADVNASVAYRLRNLDVRAFLWNRQVDRIERPIALASGSSLHRWNIISEFQYRPGGPVIDFLNTQLLDAVVEAFLTPWRRWKRSAGPRNNVTFHPISRRDVYSMMAPGDIKLKAGDLAQRQRYPLPERVCEPFSIYAPWGKRCEHLSLKLGAFFGILFGTLGALLLLGVVLSVFLRFWGCCGSRFSYLLGSEAEALPRTGCGGL